MKIDHITLGQALKQSRSKSLKLTLAVCSAYPRKDPLVQDLVAQSRAITRLIGDLDTIYHGEVSDAECNRLEHPYDPLRGPDHTGTDIGISSYRPRVGGRKQRFSQNELLAARRCQIEIGESLSYAHGMIADYGSRHRVYYVLNYVRSRNKAAGSHLGLSPVFTTDMT